MPCIFIIFLKIASADGSVVSSGTSCLWWPSSPTLAPFFSSSSTLPEDEGSAGQAGHVLVRLHLSADRDTFVSQRGHRPATCCRSGLSGVSPHADLRTSAGPAGPPSRSQTTPSKTATGIPYPLRGARAFLDDRTDVPGYARIALPDCQMFVSRVRRVAGVSE